MPSIGALMEADLTYRGVTFSPPNGPVRLVQAHRSNYDVSRAGQPRKHLMLVYHSTQGFNSENWFATKGAGGSTQWIVKDREIVHCLPDEYVPYAQGTYSNPADRRFNDKLVRDGGRPDWMPAPPTSYNTFGDPIEVEGFAEGHNTINGRTFPALPQTLEIGGKQWQNLASLTGWLMFKYPDERTLERWFRHMDLCFKKADPGNWFGAQLPVLYQHSIPYLKDFLAQAGDDPDQLDVTSGSDPAQVEPAAAIVKPAVEAAPAVHPDDDPHAFAAQLKDHEGRLNALEAWGRSAPH